MLELERRLKMEIDSVELRQEHTYINRNALKCELEGVATALRILTSVDITRVAELRERRSELTTKIKDLWKIVKALSTGKKELDISRVSNKKDIAKLKQKCSNL